jgi:hypothetical protein
MSILKVLMKILKKELLVNYFSFIYRFIFNFRVFFISIVHFTHKEYLVNLKFILKVDQKAFFKFLINLKR